jgi:hypothetical protein
MAFIFYGDNVADLYLKRRNINLASIDFDMPVIYKLPRLTARGRKAGG